MADAKQEKKEKKPLPIGKILTSLFMVLNIGVLGGGSFLVYKATLGWETVKITEEAMKLEMASRMEEFDRAPLLYTMDTFKANLTGQPVRAIELEVNVEMLNREGFEELINSDNRAMARDAIISILNDKDYQDVETIQGKLFLKDQISLALNQILKQGVVKNVYFTEFKVE